MPYSNAQIIRPTVDSSSNSRLKIEFLKNQTKQSSVNYIEILLNSKMSSILVQPFKVAKSDYIVLCDFQYMDREILYA